MMCYFDDKSQTHPTISATFQTLKKENAKLDSPAVWHGPDGENWLLVTANNSNRIYIYDANSGTELDIAAAANINIDIINQPNGISIVDNYLFITGRGDKKVHVSKLPEFRYIGSFGENILSEPFGISVSSDKINNQFFIFITDVKVKPVKSDYKSQVHKFSAKIDNDRIFTDLIRTFNSSVENGKLLDVESIIFDSGLNRIYIADESTKKRNVKVYQSNGDFLGKTIGDGIIKYEPEGIAIYTCGNYEGYLLVVDQHDEDNAVHVFNRKTLDWIDSFSIEKTKNTDGIYITQKQLPNFPMGALYIVNNDSNVTAVSWEELVGELNINSC